MQILKDEHFKGQAENTIKKMRAAGRNAKSKRTEKTFQKNFEKRLDKLQKVWYNKEVAAVKNDSEKRNKKQLAS